MAKQLQFTSMVPETYVQQSRDMQMLLELLDICFNGNKYNIDSMLYLNYPELCNDKYLKLLSHKLGFEYDCVIYDDELRKILRSFRHLVEYKGSLKGINDSIHVFMNLKHIYFDYTIQINNDEIWIMIYQQKVEDLSILSEILKYIIPCGYIYKYYFISRAETEPTKFSQESEIKSAVLNIINNTSHSVISPNASGTIINIENNDANISQNDIINAFNTMQVVSHDDIEAYKNGDKHIAIREERQNPS